MKFSGKEKDKILDVLYEIYDEWQVTLNCAVNKKKVNKGQIEVYEYQLKRF